MSRHFRLTLETNEPSAALISVIRRHTGKPISELRATIAKRKPFLDEKPHHNNYSEFISKTTQLIDELESLHIVYLVEIDGASESTQYLRNVFNLWHEIREDLQAYDDRVFGEEP